MKHIIVITTMVLALLSSCADKPKPSTTPLHPSQPTVIATTPEQMRDVVTQLMSTDSLREIMSEDLYSLTTEAQHLIVGNANGEPYIPFSWNMRQLNSPQGNNEILQVNVGSDSVTVEMEHKGPSGITPYTLVMRYENHHWCVDDILWTDKTSPADSERHAISNYSADAIAYLTGGDAHYIVEANLLPIVPDFSNEETASLYRMHPGAIDDAILTIETAQHFLKQNRGYTDELDHRISNILQDLRSQK